MLSLGRSRLIDTRVHVQGMPIVNDIFAIIYGLPFLPRLIAFAGIAAATHLIVILIRRKMTKYLLGRPGTGNRKLKSIATLTSSALVFTLYFLAIGLILREFGVSLTAYLASASVLGLAIGFGSQGIVQDVVTGLTFIFSDLLDVGDLVEIAGQTGIVRSITMRFVRIENALGADVYIPNRTIGNVINYPRSYVRCIADVTLRGDENAKNKAEETTLRLVRDITEQFAGILMTEPSREGRLQLASGKEILRVKFRIWPNRGQPIETTFVEELAAELRLADPNYQRWMIAISYEVEKKIR